MSEKSELRDRVLARKKELEAKLIEFKADTKGILNQKIPIIKQQLNDLQKLIKSGWENVTEAAAKKLNDWLSKNKNI